MQTLCEKVLHLDLAHVSNTCVTILSQLYLYQMLEALVSVAIAGIAGGAALNNRLHQRVNNVHDRISGLDRRIDAIELGVAQDYVSKADLSVMTKRMEDHMVRIENKLDQIVLRHGT